VHSRTFSAHCTAAELTEQEAAVNRLKIRLCATSAGLAACGVILAGCGSGQISQTATQQAAVNGTAAQAKDIGRGLTRHWPHALGSPLARPPPYAYGGHFARRHVPAHRNAEGRSLS
jgi:hypothetical protein